MVGWTWFSKSSFYFQVSSTADVITAVTRRLCSVHQQTRNGNSGFYEDSWAYFLCMLLLFNVRYDIISSGPMPTIVIYYFYMILFMYWHRMFMSSLEYMHWWSYHIYMQYLRAVRIVTYEPDSHTKPISSNANRSLFPHIFNMQIILKNPINSNVKNLAWY